MYRDGRPEDGTAQSPSPTFSVRKGKNMPTYEYSCLNCGNKFDIFATLSEKEKGLKTECPKCKSKKTSQVFGKISIITPGKSKSSPSSCPPICPPRCSCPN